MQRFVAVALLLCGSAGAAAERLSEEDREVLAVGPITPGERFGGAAVGLVLGFGTGQGVQGRMRTRGWIFTLADTALFATSMITLTQCWQKDPASAQDRIDKDWCNVFVGTVIVFAGVRAWQVADALLVPPRHNRRLHEVRMKANEDLRYLPTPPGWRSYVLPTPDGRGAIAGGTLSF
jgi:hypothetical protein